MQRYHRREAEGAFTACSNTVEGTICRSLSNRYFLPCPEVTQVDSGSFKLVGSARMSKAISVAVGMTRVPMSTEQGAAGAALPELPQNHRLSHIS